MRNQVNVAEKGGKIDSRPVAAWLIIVCALIAILISIGGYTRLTNSGLSIVEWAPVSGIVPPLNEHEWRQEFENYKQYTEFRIANSDMQLDGFKRIFWIEYLHRAIARFIAVAFFAPYAFFLLRRKLSKPFAIRLLLVFALGGAQGALGWYMVKSGLADNPSVSHYRLTAHLGLAVIIYGYLLWLVTGLLMQARHYVPKPAPSVRRAALTCMALIALMQVSGGFMAGTHAGFGYSTFPDMNGEWFPTGMLTLEPLWRNLSDNVITIQFAHRWIAALLVLAIAWLWLTRFRNRNPSMRWLHDAALAVAVIQFCLGAATVLSQVWIPAALAHQMGFVCLLSVLVVLLRLSLAVRTHGMATAC